MKKVIAAAVATAMVAGCGLVPKKPKEEVVPAGLTQVLQYDYSLDVVKRSKDREVQTCLGMLREPTLTPMAVKEDGLREFSRCGMLIQDLMGRASMGNELPPTDSPEAQKRLSKENLDRSLASAKKFTEGKLVMTQFDGSTFGDGLYRVETAKWRIGQYNFELSPAGLTYIYQSKVVFEPYTKTMQSGKKMVLVRESKAEGITSPRSAN